MRTIHDTGVRALDALADRSAATPPAGSRTVSAAVHTLAGHWKEMAVEEKEKFVERVTASLVDVIAATASFPLGRKVGVKVLKAAGKAIRKQRKRMKKQKAAAAKTLPVSPETTDVKKPVARKRKPVARSRKARSNASSAELIQRRRRVSESIEEPSAPASTADESHLP